MWGCEIIMGDRDVIVDGFIRISISLMWDVGFCVMRGFVEMVFLYFDYWCY